MIGAMSRKSQKRSEDKPASDRFQAESWPGIKDSFDHTTIDVGRSYRFQGRKLRPGPLLNALAVWFTKLDPSEQNRIAGEALHLLESEIQRIEGGEVTIKVKMKKIRNRDDGTPVDPTPPKAPKRKHG